ncbi:MAG TPA: glycosyltransferase family 39 protein [Solirubrobacteraceae bacterium]|nr:glycosyltransferase family 39 protein [Solirubrobacteraceae bacterium]
MSSSRVLRALAVGVILVLALFLRLEHNSSTPYKAVNDAGTYNRLAGMVAQHGDYATGDAPGDGVVGSRGPTAYFPPGFPYLLAVADLIDGHQSGHKAAIAGERAEMAVLGTVSVALIGLVAAEAFGGVIALVAMLLAAVYPVFIALSGTLVAENLVVPLELLAAWAGLRARRSGRPLAWLAGAGGFIGLATLTHQNAIVLLLPLSFAAAVAIRAQRPGPEPRVQRPGPEPGPPARPRRGRTPAAITLMSAAAALAIAPWTIRNAAELHAFVPVSTETGVTLVGTYNAESAGFAPVPYKWRFVITLPEDRRLLRHAGSLDEVQLSDRLTSQALSYISAHPAAPLQAGWHNFTRMLELEGSYAWHASGAAIGLSAGTARTGVIGFWILGVLALIGALTPAVRRGPLWLWGFPLLMALTVVFVNVETPRFREPVDPFLVLLAACALGSVVERVLGRRGTWTA